MGGLTDLFIRRPVLSIVVSALILLCGLRGFLALPVQQYPTTVSAEIQIQTSYYGADPATIAGFITTPIENVVAQADGIDYLVSQSQTGQSTVTLYLRLNQDPNAVLAEVQSYVSSITNQLPTGFQPPAITLSSNSPDVVDLSVLSATEPPERVSDYVSRVIQPQLQAVTGVQNVQNWLQMTLAVHVWLDPRRLASYGVSANDVATALQNNDYVTGVGQTMGGTTYINLAITSGVHDAQAFRRLVVKRTGTSLIRLGDVGDVEYGPDVTTFHLNVNHKTGVFLGVNATPHANVLATATAVEPLVPGGPAAPPARILAQHRARRRRQHPRLAAGGGVVALGVAGDRGAGDLPVPRLAALGADPAGDDPAVAGGHLRADGGARLLDQHADAAGAGAGDRPGGGRCHHRGG